jgi:hypothetical protein
VRGLLRGKTTVKRMLLFIEPHAIYSRQCFGTKVRYEKLPLRRLLEAKRTLPCLALCKCQPQVLTSRFLSPKNGFDQDSLPSLQGLFQTQVFTLCEILGEEATLPHESSLPNNIFIFLLQIEWE